MAEKIGKYQVLEPIARGGMGTIYKAYDPVLDRLVALKVISTEAVAPDELRARFLREGHACALLSHPNIVTVYAMGEDNGQPFIVMELLEGEDLKHLIAERRPLALEDKLSIMVQVCEGLDYAHRRGIVHRDIKPDNIFVARGGWTKILDFGIARMANAGSVLTRAGCVMGSLRYASPEQMRGRMDHRSDIFSAGAVFYELLAMRPAFVGDDPLQLLAKLRSEDPPALDQLDPGIPSALAAVIARAMRKDPSERFPDLNVMRLALETVRQSLSEETVRRLDVRTDDAREQPLAPRQPQHVWRPAPFADDPAATTPSTRLAQATIEPADTVPAETRWRTAPTGGEQAARVGAAGAAGSARRLGFSAVAMAAVGALAVIGMGMFLPPFSPLGLPSTASTVSSVEPPARREGSQSPTPTPAASRAVDRKPATRLLSDGPDAPRLGAPPERAVVPASAPRAPQMEARPLTSRQAVSEVLQSRNPAHSVIATVLKDPVRIGQDHVQFSITSSRPGYVYVMVVRGNGSSNGTDVELLLPNTAHTENRIGPGQPLTLPGPRWPLKAQGRAGTNEFLAIVSDEPRDFDAFKPASRSIFRTLGLDGTVRDGAARPSNPLFGGTIACVTAPPCSESYGAVVFSLDAIRPDPEAVRATRRTPATIPPAAPALRQTSPRCSDLLERASLGEPLMEEEQTMLTRDCR